MRTGDGTLADWKFWVLNVVVLIALGLSLTNVMLQQGNQQRRQVLEERRAQMEQARTFTRFHRSFVESLARIAADSSDPALRRVLASRGITFEVQGQENRQ